MLTPAHSLPSDHLCASHKPIHWQAHQVCLSLDCHLLPRHTTPCSPSNWPRLWCERLQGHWCTDCLFCTRCRGKCLTKPCETDNSQHQLTGLLLFPPTNRATLHLCYAPCATWFPGTTTTMVTRGLRESLLRAKPKIRGTCDWPIRSA